MMQSAAAALPVATAASQGRPGEPRCEHFLICPLWVGVPGWGSYIYTVFSERGVPSQIRPPGFPARTPPPRSGRGEGAPAPLVIFSLFTRG